jgi:hypothetical protein
VRARRSLDAIRRDDELVDALAAGTAPDGDPVALALAEWRRDLDAPPARPHRFAVLRRQVGRGVASAAVASAVGLVSIGGVAAAATQAAPGSALWPITRVVAADRAHSREAADRARDLLSRAEAVADRPDEAARYLDEAERDTARVRRGDGERALRDRATELRRRLAAPAAEPPVTASPSPSATPSAEPSEEPSASPSETPTEAPAPGSGPSGWPAPRPSETRQPSPEPSRTARPERKPSPSPSHSRPPSAEPGLTDGGLDLLRLLLLPSERQDRP